MPEIRPAFYINDTEVRLTVLVTDEPAVGVIVVHQQSHDGHHHLGDEQSLVVVHKEDVANADADGNATLPPQDVCALRRASLTMTAHLDKKQQEA